MKKTKRGKINLKHQNNAANGSKRPKTAIKTPKDSTLYSGLITATTTLILLLQPTKSVIETHLFPNDITVIHMNDLFSPEIIVSSSTPNGSKIPKTPKNEQSNLKGDTNVTYTYTSNTPSAVFDNVENVGFGLYELGKNDPKACQNGRVVFNKDYSIQFLVALCGPVAQIYNISTQLNRLVYWRSIQLNTLLWDVTFDNGYITTIAWNHSTNVKTQNGQNYENGVNSGPVERQLPIIEYSKMPINVPNASDSQVFKLRIKQLQFASEKLFTNNLVVKAWQTTKNTYDTTVYFGYQRSLTLTNPTSPIITYAEMVPEASINGFFTLHKASFFAEDIYGVLDISFSSFESFNYQNMTETVNIVYRSQTSYLIQAKQCFIELDGTKNVFKAGKCFQIDLTVLNITSGGATISNVEPEKESLVYAYDAKKGIFWICQLDSKKRLISGCVQSSRKFVLRNDHKFHKFDNDYLGVRAYFGPSSGSPIINDPDTSITYTISLKPATKTKPAVVEYKELTNALTLTFAQGLDNIFALKPSSYSIYGQNAKDVYLKLHADNFQYGSTLVQVNRTAYPPGNVTESRLISIELYPSLPSTASLNFAKMAARDGLRTTNSSVGPNTLPFNEATIQGNNVELLLNDVDFLVSDDLGLQINSLIDGASWWFVDKHLGLVQYTDTLGVYLAPFTCLDNALYTGKLNCKPLLTQRLILNDSFHIIATHYLTDASESDLFVTAVNNQTNITQIMVFKLFSQTFQKSYFLPDFVAKHKGVSVKKLEGLYALTFSTNDSIVLYTSESSDLSHLSSPVEFNASTLDIDQRLLCPQSFHTNAFAASRIDVLTKCGHGDVRILRISLTNITGLLADPTSLKYSVKQMDFIQGGIDNFEICSIGNEYLIFNPDTKSVVMLSYENDDSSFQLYTQSLGYNSITEMHCKDESKGAVFGGLNVNGYGNHSLMYSVVYGDRLNDQRSRYHSTKNLSNTVARYPNGDFVKVYPVTEGFYAKTINNQTQEEEIRFIDLTGPKVVYRGPGVNAADYRYQVGVWGSPETVLNGSLSLHFYNTFAAVGFQKNGVTHADQGTYNLSDLALLQGDVFEITSNYSEVKISSPFSEADKQPNSTLKWSDAPQKMHNGYNITISSRVDSSGIITLGVINQFWNMTDIVLLEPCTAYDITVSQYQDMVGLVDRIGKGGGLSYFQLIRDRRTGVLGARYAQLNLSLGVDYRTDQVSISVVGDGSFAVSAVNRKINRGVFFVYTLGLDPWNPYSTDKGTVLTSFNFDSGTN